MGQKINPISLRLQATNRSFDNCWYNPYFYKNLLVKDLFLQNYLNTFLKLLKLPSARYSIQHLQKKTQIYTFLCHSKSTREWRSKLFGFHQKQTSVKKFRYFLKKKGEFQMKTRENFKKLHLFYSLLNQREIYKIQKKITSFQNLKLWSRLGKPITKLSLIPNLNQFVSFQKNNGRFFNCLKTNRHDNSIFNTFSKKIYTIEKIEKGHSLLPVKNTMEKCLILEKKSLNSTLLFLHNLFIYKKIKLNHQFYLKPKNKCHPFSEKVFFNSLDLKYTKYLESSLTSFYNLNLNLTPFTVKNDWQNAQYLADEIVYFLERRIPFRRLKSKLLRQLTQISAIRGIRISCSGRVGGKSKKAQRAKTECLKYGQTSLQVFSSKIGFTVKTAFTSFGSVGVKVWICYN